MIIAVKCPSCNANLQIPDDVEFVTCEYCDTSIKVRDVVRIETDYDVPEWIKIADNAYKGENYDESYEYYNMVLEKESFRANAWIGKGYSAGRLSDDNDPRFDEMMQLVTYGLSITDEKKREEEKTAIKKELLSILQDYFSRIRKDKFDFKSDFNDYAKEGEPFVKACGKAHSEFFSQDIIFTKFYCIVLRNYLQTNYETGAETRVKIEISEPKKSEYVNKLRTMESRLDSLDPNYETFDEANRKKTTKKIIVSAIAIFITAVIVIFAVKYFINLADKNKAKINNEQTPTPPIPSSDYEVVNKSIKNKRIIYTVYTETSSLDDIKKYADALVTRDEGQVLSITIFFLSNKEEAAEFGGKEIPLRNTNKGMPEYFSARVKFNKGKDLKELHYYEKTKLVSETY